MSVARLRRVVLAAALVPICAAAGVAGPASPAASPPPAVMKTFVGATPEAVAADPAGTWQRFLAEAELGAAYKHFDVMDDVGYAFSTVEADRCRDHADALRAAVEAVPVSIALHRVAMMCAEAVGDQDDAEREAAALAALSKHALAAHGDGVLRRPILVLSPRDVYALIALLGYEFRYEYYKTNVPQRYLPMAVAAWDPDAKVERHLVFDFVDTAHAIDRDDMYSTFPFQRHLLADAFTQAQKKGGETVGIDRAAVRVAQDQSDLGERMKSLREGAAAGGLSSIIHWMAFCAEQKTSGCADGLIDALLPLAEREHAAPMALLALAYSEGIGIARDTRAAAALLDAADRRWYQHGASVFYAALEAQLRAGRNSDFAVRRLQRAIDAGNVDAEALMVLVRIMRSRKPVLSTKDIEILQRPSNNGLGLGAMLVAAYHEDQGHDTEFRAMLRKAAEAGQPGSQRAYARLRIKAGAPEADWWPWMAAAAQGGDIDAMRFLSDRAVDAGEWKAAAGWLLAAVAVHDVASIYALAALYEEEHPGLNGGLAEAIDTYEALAEDPGDNGSEARRRLALLAIDGRGMKRNYARAKRLLLPDAERGDVESQALLGAIQLEQDDATEWAEAERWLQTAIAAGSNEARIDYARWLHNRAESRPEDRVRARALLREADPEGGQYDTVRNNLAWMLCVSRHDDTRDPAAGLTLAREMERVAGERMPPPDIDTVAACYAANADYANAARLQQKAIDGLPKGGDGKPQGDPGMFDRLTLYRAGQGYIERD